MVIVGKTLTALYELVCDWHQTCSVYEQHAMPADLISFVIPVRDEKSTLREVFEKISTEMLALDRKFEVIFVDDGSTDGSWECIQNLSEEHRGKVVAFRFHRHCGKADALATGLRAAKGQMVFTMDGDAQNDPADIPLFLAKAEEGFDIVCGWRKFRSEPWHRALAGTIVNRMLSSLCGTSLHDHQCGFKCYNAKVLNSLPLQGEMRRVLPSVATAKGFKSAEIVIKHHPRRFRRTEHCMKESVRWFREMMGIYFLDHFRERPLHLCGGLALASLLMAVALMASSAIHGLDARVGLAMTVAAITLATCTLPLVAVGFIGEIIVRRFGKEGSVVIADKLEATPRSRPQDCEGKIIPLPPQEKPVILVAEDERQMRELLRLQLETAGFDVEEAADGEEAMEKIHDGIGVVLLDLAMPGKTGIECLTLMRKRFADVRIVIVSGNDEVSTAVRTMKLGAFDYLTKPFAANRLIDTVKRALALRGLTAGLMEETA